MSEKTKRTSRMSSMIDRIKNINIPKYQSVDGKDLSDTGLTNEMIHKHRAAILRGETPQEMRDLGIDGVEFVDRSVWRQMTDGVRNIRNRLDKTKDDIKGEYEEGMNSEPDGDEINNGSPELSESEQAVHDPASEFDSMTNERKEELGYHPRAEYRTMAPHIREKWDAQFQNNDIVLTDNDLSDLDTGLNREIDTESVQLSSSDICDLNTTEHSHQL